MPFYFPQNHFWLVNGNTEQVYSSRAAAYLPLDHADYVAWQANGGWPTPILNEAELADVLAAQYPAGWPPAVAPGAVVIDPPVSA